MGHHSALVFLVTSHSKPHTMIALVCLALVAVAAAAPQRQQIITSAQLPLNYQTLRTIQQPYQTIQTIPAQYQTIQTLPAQYQTIQDLQGLRGLQGLRTVPVSGLVQPELLQYQTVPYNTINGLNLQPAQVRLAQVKPVQVRTQTIKTVQAPLTIKEVSPAQVRVQTVTPQVQTLQTVVPQVQRISTVVPQVQRISNLQSIYGQRNQYYNNQLAYDGVTPLAPQGLNILRQVQEVQADGTYAYAFETENGIKAQEEGRTINQGTDGQSAVVQGSYSYTAPDGTPITVNYVADENGFRAEGEHIPKPSEEIQRSVEYLRSLPPRPEDQEGQYTRDSNGY